MFRASYVKHDLIFNFPAKTSRGAIEKHTVFILCIEDTEKNIKGYGEAAPLKGLSLDDREDFEDKVKEICRTISETQNYKDALKSAVVSELPSLHFAVEAAFADLSNGGKGIYFENDFASGKMSLPVNGLVWMSDYEKMLRQAEEKFEKGFDCIKCKIGAINYDDEIKLLTNLRKKYGNKITLRVDANGAFDFPQAKNVLNDLKKLDIHSIEQPLATENWEEMSDLCALKLVPIALDDFLRSPNILFAPRSIVRCSDDGIQCLNYKILSTFPS